jgi:hypothetical protein
MRRFIGIGLALGLGLASVGCDDQGSPASPSAGGQSVTRIQIVGPESVDPGKTAQLGVTATLADGTTHDVSRQVTWQSSNPELLIVSSGLVTASYQFGEAQITARYPGAANASAGVASRSLLVLPAGTFRLKGLVKSDGAPVDGATIEIAGDTAAAAVSTAGTFVAYGIAGNVEITVSKDGFVPQARRVTVSAHQSDGVDFELLPSIEGTYTLRLVAAAECRAGLPDDARERTYLAKIAQSGPNLDVTLTGATLDSDWFGRGFANAFRGAVEAGRVSLSLPRSRGIGTILDNLTGSDDLPRYLAVFGSVTTTRTPDGYSGALVGTFQMMTAGDWWSSPLSSSGGSCTSFAHQFTLSR